MGRRLGAWKPQQCRQVVGGRRLQHNDMTLRHGEGVVPRGSSPARGADFGKRLAPAGALHRAVHMVATAKGRDARGQIDVATRAVRQWMCGVELAQKISFPGVLPYRLEG